MVEFGDRTFSIHSANSDRELIFHGHTEHYFEVDLKGSGLAALIRVWKDEDVKDLNTFLHELAAFKTPWQGVQGWASYDLQLSLAAKCTTLGQVTFQVKLCNLTGSPEDWQVEAGLATELGQLEKIAQAANTFFQKESA